MQDFSFGENSVLTMNATKILLPSRILAGILKESFLGQNPGEYRFFGRILAKIHGVNFTWEGSHRKNWSAQRDRGTYFMSRQQNLILLK